VEFHLLLALLLEVDWLMDLKVKMMLRREKVLKSRGERLLGGLQVDLKMFFLQSLWIHCFFEISEMILVHLV